MKAAEDGEIANVSVVVRVRPPLPHEVRHGLCTRVSGTRHIVFDGGAQSLGERQRGGHDARRAKTIDCEYDHVLDMPSSQEDVWRAICPKVEKVLQGYNATVFTYGMTGSGKTFTMLGPKLMSIAWKDEAPTFQEVRQCPNRGLVPRVAELLFGRLASGCTTATSSRVSMSYLQIYQERCYDLLQPATSAQPLKVREEISSSRSAASGVVYAEGLTEITVKSAEELLAKLLYGSSNIAFRSTAYNEQSSRSHVILTITLHQTLSAKDGLMRESKLNLVDLAGNERWDTFSQGMSPSHAREMTSINQSLHVLGNCIQALSAPQQVSKRDGNPVPVHVPYRNSALTMLLRDSLGGSSFTVMLCTICSCSAYQMQSLCTLRFADRAKRVQMRARVNQTVDAKMILQQTQAEVLYLRSLVAQGGASAELQKQLDKLEGENRNLKEKVQNLTAERFEIRSCLMARGLSEVDLRRSGAAQKSASLGPQQADVTEVVVPQGDSAGARAARLRRTNSEPALPGSSLLDFDSQVGNVTFQCAATHSVQPVPRREIESSANAPDEERDRSCNRNAIRPPASQTKARPSPRHRQSMSKILADRLSGDCQELRSSSCSRAVRSGGSDHVRSCNCPQGHTLVPLGSSRQPLASAAYGEWHCDAPNCTWMDHVTSPDMARFHCAECQYDICEHCHRRMLEALPLARESIKDAAESLTQARSPSAHLEAHPPPAPTSSSTSTGLPTISKPTIPRRGKSADTVAMQMPCRSGSNTSRMTSHMAEARGVPEAVTSGRESSARAGATPSLQRGGSSQASLASDYWKAPLYAKPQATPRSNARGKFARSRQADHTVSPSPPVAPLVHRVGGPTAVRSARSHSERGRSRVTSDDRERQQQLMQYYQQKFVAPPEVVQAPSSALESAMLASRSTSDAPYPEDSYKDVKRLPPISQAPPLASPQVGSVEIEADDLAATMQRRPWHAIDGTGIGDEIAWTQRQFYQPTSPRVLEAKVNEAASLPPVTGEQCANPGRSCKVASRRPPAVPSMQEPIPFRLATGAPLSPLAPRHPGSLEHQAIEARKASTQPARASQTSPTPSISAAKSIAALHTRLSIDGLLPSVATPEPLEAAEPPAVDAPEAKRAALPQASIQRSKPHGMAALFGASGKASGIGALLGELDTCRDMETVTPPANRCGDMRISGEDQRQLAAPMC